MLTSTEPVTEAVKEEPILSDTDVPGSVNAAPSSVKSGVPPVRVTTGATRSVVGEVPDRSDEPQPAMTRTTPSNKNPLFTTKPSHNI